MSLRCTQSTLSNFATIYQIYKLYPGQDGVRKGGRRVVLLHAGQASLRERDTYYDFDAPGGVTGNRQSDIAG